MSSAFLINTHDFLAVSEVNGPGKRSVLWVQGCCFDCPCCFNQEARKKDENKTSFLLIHLGLFILLSGLIALG